MTLAQVQYYKTLFPELQVVEIGPDTYVLVSGDQYGNTDKSGTLITAGDAAKKTDGSYVLTPQKRYSVTAMIIAIVIVALITILALRD